MASTPRRTASTPQQGAPVWEIAPEPVGSDDSGALLRAYYSDIVDRYHRHHHGRAATAAEVDAAMTAEPSGHLAPPDGLFLVARRDGTAYGCAGVHLLAPGTAELTRVHVAPSARRGGLGSRLLTAAERAARERLGAARLCLDTRSDLVEARAMYAARGYAEVPAYHDGPYADHFFAKHLTP
ncbi:GNAT family N-acetyltransferase [Streptomyces sp. PTM05]|uniref:GNAT family N-acetyltransferase n=1 Tax=Streptantibioticus parmotrematis TaxID=2873249 RepID=A0ABS7QXA4_9ACTN|nr:GNAT family N-acetyltransferase [Streptantibioticus parmotrematis]MBY8887568.1 GNAT family N-acetyltransferase [Streptantibioticus parmotrematis]